MHGSMNVGCCAARRIPCEADAVQPNSDARPARRQLGADGINEPRPRARPDMWGGGPLATLAVTDLTAVAVVASAAKRIRSRRFQQG